MQKVLKKEVLSIDFCAIFIYNYVEYADLFGKKIGSLLGVLFITSSLFVKKGTKVMSKRKLSILALVLVFVMLLPSLVACNNTQHPEESTSNPPEQTSGEEPSEQTTQDIDTSTEESESDTTGDETETYPIAPAPELEGEYADIIKLSNSLANGVNVFYPNASRKDIVIENRNMSLDYHTDAFADKIVKYINNTKGASYIENTMDVYVKMKGNDNRFYAASSSKPSTMNIYRYGYYYYQVLIDGQDFISEYAVKDQSAINSKPDRVSQLEQVETADGYAYTVTNTRDPQIAYIDTMTPVDAEKYNYLEVTMKIDAKDPSFLSSTTVFIIAGSSAIFSDKQQTSFNPIADGEFHTYYISLDSLNDYTGQVKGVRLDLDGNVGDVFTVKDVKLVNADINNAPMLGLNRIFNTYSDKLVQNIQITATEDTDNIEEIGMVTKIAAETVDKLIVKDAAGTHTALEGVDWATAEYVGFDIKNVGIFGYILLADETSGSMTVELDGENYVITQFRQPKDGTLLVPTEAVLNTLDFYMGQRIYTDESHDFETFLKEAYCERNPLPAESFTVNTEGLDKAVAKKTYYVGYNALRGTYEFNLFDTGFNTAYHLEWNRQPAINFTVKGDGYDRTIYMESTADGGQLECAVLLDKDQLLLPVPVEVYKNFSDGDGSIHYIKDIPISNTYLPIPVAAESETEYFFIHLYQNWGRFPLKQISAIQFHCPYYHLSTGVTETNCIVNWYTTKSTRNIYSVLPDHRAMSGTMRAREPQHESGGDHGFLEYTDANGQYSASENIKNTITAYGPTYAEITMDYISDDGRIKVSYTHMEMPQTDENRTYYEIAYEVLEDIEISDFKNDFSFYTVVPKPGIDYQWIGYLDENNRIKHRGANKKTNARQYVLGDKFPYFSLYQDDPEAKDAYVNLSFLIHSSEFIIGGEKSDARFMITDHNNIVKLSLDLDAVTLKAGDTFKINAIIMPWGGDNIKDYITYADKNVTDVRDNSLINPYTITALNNCHVEDTVFLPTVVSHDGKNAEFTLSGGANNCTVKIKGMTSNTIPTVYELDSETGEWERYNLSSHYYLDKKGYANDYDGYGVQYEDGYFSYSFVVDMGTEGAERTFKFVADKDAYEPEAEPEGGPIGGPVEQVETIPGYNKIWYAEDLEAIFYEVGGLGKIELLEDSQYVRVYGDGASNDPNPYVHTTVNEPNEHHTGQYFVFKYRLPETISHPKDYFCIFTSTEFPMAKAEGQISYVDLAYDNQWRVVILDLSALVPDTYLPAEDGGYYAQHVRFDFINRVIPKDSYVEFEYMAFDDDFYSILNSNKDMESVTFYNGISYQIKTDGGKLPVRLEPDTMPNMTDYNVYISAKQLAYKAATGGNAIGMVDLAEDESSVTISVTPGNGDNYFRPYSVDAEAPETSGQYLVYKYRTTGTEKNYFEIWTSTVNTKPTAGDGLSFTTSSGLYSADGQWHIVVVDLATANPATIVADEDGTYTVKFIRFDTFNTKFDTDEYKIDLAFVALCDDLNTAVTYDTSVDQVIFYDGTNIQKLSTATGEVITE